MVCASSPRRPSARSSIVGYTGRSGQVRAPARELGRASEPDDRRAHLDRRREGTGGGNHTSSTLPRAATADRTPRASRAPRIDCGWSSTTLAVGPAELEAAEQEQRRGVGVRPRRVAEPVADAGLLRGSAGRLARELAQERRVADHHVERGPRRGQRTACPPPRCDRRAGAPPTRARARPPSRRRPGGRCRLRTGGRRRRSRARRSDESLRRRAAGRRRHTTGRRRAAGRGHEALAPRAGRRSTGACSGHRCAGAAPRRVRARGDRRAGGGRPPHAPTDGRPPASRQRSRSSGSVDAAVDGDPRGAGRDRWRSRVDHRVTVPMRASGQAPLPVGPRQTSKTYAPEVAIPPVREPPRPIGEVSGDHDGLLGGQRERDRRAGPLLAGRDRHRSGRGPLPVPAGAPAAVDPLVEGCAGAPRVRAIGRQVQGQAWPPARARGLGLTSTGPPPGPGDGASPACVLQALDRRGRGPHVAAIVRRLTGGSRRTR